MSRAELADGDRTPLLRFAGASWDSLCDLVVPSRCLACEAPRRELFGGGVCPACWSSLPLLDPSETCTRCAIPVGGAVDPGGGAAELTGGVRCAACLREPPPVARAAALALYAGVMAKLVAAYKFHGADLLAAPAGRRLAALGARAGLDRDVDAVVPIPSTRRRNRERGYDPAELLAREVSRSWRRPLRPLLRRVRDTVAQSRLPAARRAENVRGAFTARTRAKGLALLLVDDVVTTGSTAFAAAQALLGAGAKRVDLLALARTPEPDDFRHPERGAASSPSHRETA